MNLTMVLQFVLFACNINITNTKFIAFETILKSRSHTESLRFESLSLLLHSIKNTHVKTIQKSTRLLGVR